MTTNSVLLSKSICKVRSDTINNQQRLAILIHKRTTNQRAEKKSESIAACRLSAREMEEPTHLPCNLRLVQPHPSTKGWVHTLSYTTYFPTLLFNH